MKEASPDDTADSVDPRREKMGGSVGRIFNSYRRRAKAESSRRNVQHGKSQSTVRASETGPEERQDSPDRIVTWRWSWIAVALILISIVAGTIIYTQSKQKPETFKDCDNCPEMVVVPAGSFLMGSPKGEAGRKINESPQRKVTIDRNFAVSKYEVTRGQFAHFIRKSGHDMSVSCWPNRRSTPSSQHPVVCVNWQDAKAYAQWLTKKTGKPYRLLSEAEWEYAARAGTATSRYWGDGWQAACKFAQVSWCGSHRSAPVGQYQPNEYGLYDMLGNVWEWVEDCWNDSYKGAPTDGSAWTSGQCEERVLRGGPFVYGPHYVRSARRVKHSRYIRNDYYGIRLASTLP
jgi:formylglycine-generating enzyme required for sulfatase activity